MVERQREKIYNGQMGDKKFGDERAALAEAGLNSTVEVYISEKSEEGVTVIRQWSSSKNESWQEL